MRGSWVEGRHPGPPLRMRAPGTQSFTCQAPPTQFSQAWPCAHRQQLLPALPPLLGGLWPSLWDSCTAPAGGWGFIRTLPAPAPKNNLKLLKSPRPPAADSGPTALGVRDLSDEQRTSASSGPSDPRPSSRPPSSSESLPGSAPLCGYARDPSSLCSEPSGQPAANTDSKATEQTHRMKP